MKEKWKILTLVIVYLLLFSTFLILIPLVRANTLSSNPILYAGGHNPGVVYRYLGGINWEVISPELGYAVMDLIEYNGHLYAGVTTGFSGYNGMGKVYKYDGDKKWILVGDNMDHAVISLAVYKGNLYAGTGRGAFRLYKYTPGMTNCGIQNWTRVVDYPWDGVRSLYASPSYLLMGDSSWDRIGRWDGSKFYTDLDGGGSCIYDFIEYGNHVYAAAYMGRLWCSQDAVNWNVVLGYYDGNMWELEVFKNKLYMAYNNGELRVWNGIGDLRGELVYKAQDGIISMTTDGNYLYFGTGGDAIGYGYEIIGTANVYRYDGTNVELITKWDQMGTGVQVIYVSTMPDLTISEIKPVQVIWDCDINDDSKIDLVAGKSTMIRCKVKMLNYETLDKTTLVRVQLQIPQYKTYNTEATIEYLEKNNGTIDFYIDPPTLIGDLTILAKIDPENEIKEANESNNEESIEITVKDTRALYLTYLPVYAHTLRRNGSDPPWGYGPLNLEECSEAVENSGKFILATYPITTTEFINKKIDGTYYGSPIPLLGLLKDMINIYDLGKRFERLTDRVIGIVPEDYFAFHGKPDVGGFSFIGISGVLVRVDCWTVTAHEIGHTYGLPAGIYRWPLHIPGEEYDTIVGRAASGFWVEGHKEVKNSTCFMGKVLYLYFPEYENNYFGAWVCSECYEYLFKEFRLDDKDPEILLVNGIIFKNGTIQFGKWYWLDKGSISHVYPGNYSIQIIDFNGNIIYEIPFAAPFAAYADPIGVIEMNVTGFAFAIPYPDTASIIKLQYNGETIIALNLNIKLLHDAIDCIPENAFVKDGIGRRKALHNKINEIEEKIMKNLIIDARNKLKFDLRDKLQKWLIDNYEITDPLQLSKNEILALVDEIINRLNIQIS